MEICFFCLAQSIADAFQLIKLQRFCIVWVHQGFFLVCSNGSNGLRQRLYKTQWKWVLAP